MPDVNELFIEFLRKTPAAMADFARMVKAWLDVHGEIPAGGATPTTPGPRTWEEGEKHDLSTAGLAQADLDALIEASAEADVIEKFTAYARGFISGVMFKGI
jgi:hypothetical protein